MGYPGEYSGVNKLARVLQRRMQDLNDPTLVLDFGGIQSDFSLKTNTFPVPIPKSDYLIAWSAAYGNVGSVLTNENGEKTVKMGRSRVVNPGDRVLVAWVGNDAVVIDVLVSAAEVM